MSEGPYAGEWDPAMTSRVKRGRVVGNFLFALSSVTTKNLFVNLEERVAPLWLSTIRLRWPLQSTLTRAMREESYADSSLECFFIALCLKN